MDLYTAKNMVAHKYFREKWSALSPAEQLRHFDEVAELYCQSNNGYTTHSDEHEMLSDLIPEGHKLNCVSSNALVYGKPCNKWCGFNACLSKNKIK